MPLPESPNPVGSTEPLLDSEGALPFMNDPSRSVDDFLTGVVLPLEVEPVPRLASAPLDENLFLRMGRIGNELLRGRPSLIAASDRKNSLMVTGAPTPGEGVRGTPSGPTEVLKTASCASSRPFPVC